MIFPYIIPISLFDITSNPATAKASMSITYSMARKQMVGLYQTQHSPPRHRDPAAVTVTAAAAVPTRPARRKPRVRTTPTPPAEEGCSPAVELHRSYVRSLDEAGDGGPQYVSFPAFAYDPARAEAKVTPGLLAIWDKKKKKKSKATAKKDKSGSGDSLAARYLRTVLCIT